MGFNEKFRAAKPGEEFVYHTGGFLPEFLDDKDQAWSAYERGDVILYQRRRHDGRGFDYCARRKVR
jgi:hypothetical protein